MASEANADGTKKHDVSDWLGTAGLEMKSGEAIRADEEGNKAGRDAAVRLRVHPFGKQYPNTYADLGSYEGGGGHPMLFDATTDLKYEDGSF